jgi:5-methylcytosine-specific restriction endonuclease McrA
MSSYGVRILGDHIIERKDGGAELDPNNIQLLCLGCHNAKTATARKDRGGVGQSLNRRRNAYRHPFH